MNAFILSCIKENAHGQQLQLTFQGLPAAEVMLAYEEFGGERTP